MAMPTTPPSVHKHMVIHCLLVFTSTQCSSLPCLPVSTSTQCLCLPRLQRCECLCHQQPRFHCRQSAGRSVMLCHHLLPEVKHCHNMIHTTHTHTCTNTHANCCLSLSGRHLQHFTLLSTRQRRFVCSPSGSPAAMCQKFISCTRDRLALR